MNSIDVVINSRKASIGPSMDVRRILPFRERRMVGPFCFLDHMGPALIQPDRDNDVKPHPHIGLSTVTYLFEGRLTHRDSLGTLQDIEPGDVNWMTAGKGIVHSERTPLSEKHGSARLHGLQAWVALPIECEQMEPQFRHHPKTSLPHFDIDGTAMTLIAGSAFGYNSPVQTHSRLFYIEAKIPMDGFLKFDPQEQEAAFYIVHGEVKIDGSSYQEGQLVVFKKNSRIEIRATKKTHGLILGGEPIGSRYIDWNFVASNKELIEAAKVKWKEQKFDKIKGEAEWTPLPQR